MDAEIGFKYGWQKNSWNSRNEISKTVFVDITYFYLAHNKTIFYALEIFNIEVEIREQSVTCISANGRK